MPVGQRPNLDAISRLWEWTRGALEGAGETAPPVPLSALTSRTGAMRFLASISPITGAMVASPPNAPPDIRQAAREGATASAAQIALMLRLRYGDRDAAREVRDQILAARETALKGTPRQKGQLAGMLGGAALGMAMGKMPKGVGISQMRHGEAIIDMPAHLRYWAHVAEQSPTPEVFAQQLSTFRRSFDAAMERGQTVPASALLTHPQVAAHYRNVGRTPIEFQHIDDPLVGGNNVFPVAFSEPGAPGEVGRIVVDPRSIRGREVLTLDPKTGKHVVQKMPPEDAALMLLEELSHQQQDLLGRPYERYMHIPVTPKMAGTFNKVLKRKGWSPVAIRAELQRLRAEGMVNDRFATQEQYLTIPQERTAKRAADVGAEYLRPTGYGSLPVASPEEFWQFVHWGAPIATGRRRTP